MYGRLRGFICEFDAQITGVQVGDECLCVREGTHPDATSVIDETLPHCRWGVVSVDNYSNLPMNTLTYDGAILVPMLVPETRR